MMLNMLLGSKFSSKCKHSVKCIKCRMETIRKKKQAMERYLKKDIADLVSVGHDAVAFGRMDALIFEINQGSCYDLIDQYCSCILERLPTMQKERDCPKDTVEAVATLIFAAARFSDLPELADLRRSFTGRYGTSMESYTNREFIEKMQQKSFTQDTKLKLMKDIAQEYNIDWNIKSFEYRISNPSTLAVDYPKKDFPSIHEKYEQPHEAAEKRETNDDKRIEAVNGRKTMLEKQPKDMKYLANKVHKEQISGAEKINRVTDDESENVEPYHFNKRAPPYVRSNKDNQNGNRIHHVMNEENTHQRSEAAVPAVTEKQAAKPIVSRNDKSRNMFREGSIQYAKDEVVKEIKHIVPGKNRIINLKPPYVKPNVSSTLETGYEKPTIYKNTAFSVRRKHLEKETAAIAGSTGEDVNYAKKTSKVLEQPIKYDQYSKPLVHSATRTASLPPMQVHVGMHVRSVSMQPDLLSPNGGAVLQRIPDYEVLVARIAALRKL